MDLTYQNIIKEFLFDSYSIDSTLREREKFKRCSSEEEKKELYHYVVLKNLFLLRRCRDPGFYTFVLNQVNTNENIKETVKKYVSKLITSNSNLEQDMFGEFIVEKDVPLLDKQIENPITWPHSSPIKKLSNFGVVNENSLHYYSKRLEYAREKGNEDEVLAISQLINDYKSGDFWGHLIFSEDKLYGEQIDSHRWLYSQNKYILENIKFSTHYFSPQPFIIQHLIPLVIHDSIFVKDFLRIIDDKTGSEEQSMLNSLLNFNKFVNDAFSVASLIWFNKKSENDKIDILNKEYSFEITEKILEEYGSAMHELGFIHDNKDLQSLSIFANELYNSQFFDDAKAIWKYMLDKTTDNLTAYNNCDNLATVFREMGDFESALKYYEQSLELAKELSQSDIPHMQQKNKHSILFNDETEKELYDYLKRFEDKFPNYDYKVAIELKNVGEMYFKIGKDENGEKCFLEAEEISSQLSPDERDSIFFNLSSANRRLKRFTAEFRYLTKLISQDIVYPDAKELALDRLDILNSIEFMQPNGEFDHENLAKIEDKKKADKLLKIGTSLFHSFQFKKSMYYFEKAYEIEKLNGFNSFNSLNYIASYNLYYGDLHKAKDFCEKLIENSQNSVLVSIARINIGLIEIQENNIQKGIEQLEIACDIFYQFDNGVLEFIISIINSSTIFWSKENIGRVIDYLEPNIVSKNVNFHLVAGCAYLEIGFFEDAIDYFDRGLLTEVDNETQSLLLYNKGLALSALGEGEYAIKMYKDSLDCLNREYAWESMAQEYRNKLNLLKAKECIEEAMKLVSGNKKERLIEIMKELDALSRKQLNLNSIKDGNVKKPLFSAEKLIISDFKKMEHIDERDFSTALQFYGKALENMLDIQVSGKIRETIYRNPKFGVCVTEKYNHFHGKYFPPYLKSMLNNNYKNSIGSMGWKKIIEYINDNSRNPVYQKFKDELKHQYSVEELEKIKYACGMIGEYRNSSAHKDIKTYDEVINIREKIVLHLNNVIYILYN